MTFQDLMQQMPWPEVEQALFRLIPEVESRLPGLQQAFDLLGQLPPRPSNFRTRFCWHPDDEIYPFSIELLNGMRHRDGPSPECYPEEMLDEEIAFGLDVAWGIFVALTPPSEALAKVTAADLLAYCLWELSWFGYTPEDCEENREAFLQELEEAEDGEWKKVETYAVASLLAGTP